ncbi:MAG TPA: aromatic ring-hydroxylating dioxygenase subunit alpha [Stellaceae bacterium]|jgi:phenylpropionate dioxygenase-like ring-hydroxylating dioxygenase large terminal subunit|nr:aromatic ring-hydroxylating dioxygenase subunit alpha [Stellaceae bacterium]
MSVERLHRDQDYDAGGLPETGLRNYWYPVLAGWRLRGKPKAIRVLGEDIVLFRDKGGKVYALANRCAHRGAMLSQGKCLYPGSGTLSCPYHGWTFSGETGQVVAKLMEGPDAPLSRRDAVKSYPIREHIGVLWVFVGDMDAVPLEDDLPECLANTADWHGFSTWRTYHCNWRIMKDNLCHDMHAPFVHRNSPELMLQPVFPHASKLAAMPLDNGKGIGYVSKDGIPGADYPGLGHFPPANETWYRFMKPTGRGKELDPKAAAVAKGVLKYRQSSLLPGITLIGRPSGDYFTCRWVVPIDAESNLFYSFSMFRRQGSWKRFTNSALWLGWLAWVHDWLFSEQDRRILQAVIPGKEALSRSDIGVVAWRRYAMTHARRPPGDVEQREPVAIPPAAAE